jgi:hypothetical protein
MRVNPGTHQKKCAKQIPAAKQTAPMSAGAIRKRDGAPVGRGNDCAVGDCDLAGMDAVTI